MLSPIIFYVSMVIILRCDWLMGSSRVGAFVYIKSGLHYTSAARIQSAGKKCLLLTQEVAHVFELRALLLLFGWLIIFHKTEGKLSWITQPLSNIYLSIHLVEKYWYKPSYFGPNNLIMLTALTSIQTWLSEAVCWNNKVELLLFVTFSNRFTVYPSDS